MSQINADATREALQAWHVANASGKKGRLTLSESENTLVFVDLTGVPKSKIGEGTSRHSIESVVEFISQHFDQIVKDEKSQVADHIQNLCKTIRAHASSKAEGKHPLEDRLKDIEIKALRQEMLSEIDKAGEISPNARKTINGIITLYMNRREIASIPDETTRNAYILHITGLLAELGFCVGRTSEDLLKNIDEKMFLLKHSFENARKEGSISEFFLKAFESGPCFNGRITTLTSYAMRKAGLPQEEVVPGIPAEETHAAMVLSDDYYSYRDGIKERGEIPSKEGFLTFLRKKYQGEVTVLTKYFENDALYTKVYPKIVLSYMEF
jgi:hypothetical protein